MSEYYNNVKTYIFVSGVLLAFTYYHFYQTDEKELINNIYNRYDKETYEFDKRCFLRHCGLNVLAWIAASIFYWFGSL